MYTYTFWKIVRFRVSQPTIPTKLIYFTKSENNSSRVQKHLTVLSLLNLGTNNYNYALKNSFLFPHDGACIIFQTAQYNLKAVIFWKNTTLYAGKKWGATFYTISIIFPYVLLRRENRLYLTIYYCWIIIKIFNKLELNFTKFLNFIFESCSIMN